MNTIPFLELCGQTSQDRCVFSAASAAATQDKFDTLLEKLRRQLVVINGKTYTYAVLVNIVSFDLFTVQKFGSLKGWTSAADLLQKAWEASAATSPDPVGQTHLNERQNMILTSVFR